MRNKKIEFRPRNPQYDILQPKPASLYIPEWYKQTPQVNEKTLTAKKCVPMLDALTAGYIIPLPVDVYWDENKDGRKWQVDAKTEIVSEHLKVQTELFDIDDSYDSQPYKWVSQWHITTPKGYSTLFVHPNNRTELPFHSFTGFVDTDKHPVIVNFPFVIKKGFSGTIPAGTPMIQAIPIKREDWQMEMKDMHTPHTYLKEYEVFSPPFGWYKRNFWSKKRYQ